MRHRAALGGALAALLLTTLTPAPAPAAAGPGPVSGRLLGPDGDPVSGAVVQLSAYGDPTPESETTTTADGRFSFAGSERPAAFVLVACADHDACRDVDEATELVKTYVGPGETAFTLPALHSTFTTADDSPAVDVGDVRMVRPATIEVVDHSGQRFGRRVARWVSGLARRPGDPLSWRVLAPGTHRVDVGYLHRTVSVGSGETRVVRFTRRVPAITGRVVAAGRPVADEHVRISYGDAFRITRTDTAGRFAFPVLPPGERFTVRVGVGEQDRLDASGPKAVHTVALGLGDIAHVAIDAPGGSRGGVAVRLSPGGRERAVLATASGRLIGAVRVVDGWARTTGLAPGRYRLNATWTTLSGQDGSLEQRADSALLRVRAGRITHARLAPRVGPREVTVHAEPGALVRLTPSSDDGDRHARVVPGSGAVRFTGLVAGAYAVTAARTPFATETEPVVVTVGTDPAEVTVPTPPAPGSFRVRLVDADTGAPWPWTSEVAPSIECGDTWANRTPDGHYEGEAWPGTYRCRLRNLWLDRGTPVGTDQTGGHPIEGTLVIRAGEQTEADLPVDLTR